MNPIKFLKDINKVVREVLMACIKRQAQQKTKKKACAHLHLIIFQEKETNKNAVVEGNIKTMKTFILK